MCIVKRQVIDIPIDQTSDIDELFGRMTKINIHNVPKKFEKVFNLTRAISYDNFKMSSIIESYKIQEMNDKNIVLDNGMSLESDILPHVFKHAFEIGLIVTSLRGYDEIDKEEENMLNKLFLDNWGTAFIERGDRWVMQFVAKELEEKELYITHAFSPGQNKIPIDLQTVIFNTLQPSQIGVTLSDMFMMHPKKSVSGMFGIQSIDENRVRPCDLCERRETCPTAYA